MTNGAITVRDDNHFCPQYATQLWAQPFKWVDYSSNLNGWPVTVAWPYSDSDRTFLAAAFPNIATLLWQPKELIVNSLGCNQGNTSGWDESIYPNGYYYYDTVNHGIYVTGSGYISYPISALGNLAGKTITIELDSPITDSNAVLLLLDSLPTGTANPAFYINSAGEPICITQTTSWCSANKVGSKYTLYLGNIVATRFQFGNGLARNKPINRTIKKITIQ
jgi:hypothetical protein